MYVTLVDANTYFTGRLESSAWDDSSDSNKTKALITASRSINNLRFIGQKLDSDQSDQFPRLGQLIVPQSVKDACCEEAYELLDGADPGMEIDNLVVSQQSLETLKISQNDGVLPHTRAGIASSIAWALLSYYLTDPNSIRLVRN